MREQLQMDQVQHYNRIESPTRYLCCSSPDFCLSRQRFSFGTVQIEPALSEYLDQFILAAAVQFRLSSPKIGPKWIKPKTV